MTARFGIFLLIAFSAPLFAKDDLCGPGQAIIAEAVQSPGEGSTTVRQLSDLSDNSDAMVLAKRYLPPGLLESAPDTSYLSVATNTDRTPDGAETNSIDIRLWVLMAGGVYHVTRVSGPRANPTRSEYETKKAPISKDTIREQNRLRGIERKRHQELLDVFGISDADIDNVRKHYGALVKDDPTATALAIVDSKRHRNLFTVLAKTWHYSRADMARFIRGEVEFNATINLDDPNQEGFLQLLHSLERLRAIPEAAELARDKTQAILSELP